MAKAPKLNFGKMTGKNRLSQREEKMMAAKGELWVRKELLTLITKTMSMSFLESFYVQQEHDIRSRLNSLVWVYVELAHARVAKNVHILSAWANLGTINKLANKAQLNASFLSRILRADTKGGGWTFGQVMRLSGALGIDPRVLLFSDLEKLIQEQETLYKERSP